MIQHVGGMEPRASWHRNMRLLPSIAASASTGGRPVGVPDPYGQQVNWLANADAANRPPPLAACQVLALARQCVAHVIGADSPEWIASARGRCRVGRQASRAGPHEALGYALVRHRRSSHTGLMRLPREQPPTAPPWVSSRSQGENSTIIGQTRACRSASLRALLRCLLAVGLSTALLLVPLLVPRQF